MDLVQTDEKDYARDTNSRALINTNRNALREHKAKKEQAARLAKVEQDVKTILETMQELKLVLQELGANR